MVKSLANVVHDLTERQYDVARYLEEKGITGYRGECSSCPLAVLILRETEGSRSYADATELVVYGDDYPNDPSDFQRVATPDFLTEFMEDFDSGGFPTLDHAVAGVMELES